MTVSEDAAPGQKMFTDEAWEAGYSEARRRGLLESRATRADVDAIVSAVVNHGTEELHADHMVMNFFSDEELSGMREHLRTQLAIEALRQNCVMLALPREVRIPDPSPSRYAHPDASMSTLRMIVPVRRLPG